MRSNFFSRSLCLRTAMVAAVAVVGTAAVGCFDQAGPPVGQTGPQNPVQTAPPTTTTAVVATINGLNISQADLNAVLYEGFGLRMLFDLVELDMAKQLLARDHLTLTDADIDRERDKVLTGLLGTDRANWDNLFNQFLQQKNLTRTEFDIKIIQTRACLRKWIEPQVKGRFTEQAIHRGFDEQYGALRRIQDIELPDLTSVAIARDRLARNEPFEKVARAMSIDTLTRDSGGAWAAFSANNEAIPKVIRQAAFGLDVGKISETLQNNETYHLIRVVEEIPPKLYKYEDYRDRVRDTLEQRYIDEAVRMKQDELRNSAIKLTRIEDPILSMQWHILRAGDKQSSMDRPEVSKRIGAGPLTTAPTTEPAPTVKTGFPTVNTGSPAVNTGSPAVNTGSPTTMPTTTRARGEIFGPTTMPSSTTVPGPTTRP